MYTTMLMFLIFSVLVNQASFCLTQSYSFSYHSFHNGSCGNGGSLICMGSVTVGNGSLSITPGPDQDQKQQESDQNLPNNEVGRVLHNQSVLAWPASFSTSFTVRILKDVNSSSYGDGMAFLMAENDKPSPPGSYGSFLGILDQSTQGGQLHQLAVELDTYKNENDPDANHIAIDTTSVLHPVAQKSLNCTGIDLKSGREITFRIDYDGREKVLQIYVAYAGEPLVNFLNHRIIMKKTVPSSVYVGFTASTGTYAEAHHLLSWNFTTYELPMKSPKYGEENKIRNIMLKAVVPVIGGLLLFAAFGLPFVLRARKRRNERVWRKEDIEMLTRNAANAPRMFTHRQLSKATHSFNKGNLLGTGGFGSVYKGVISDPPTTVAVKRISATSKQGEKEYLAEICTIGRLRHKNLLQLQGWCHESVNLLLVYDYMPNGSLDRFIGKDELLDWKTRYKILTGLASALVYLHEECGNPVVHRDVKPNNVMLDSEYNAHLGDFGLARLLEKNEASVTTMIAGTPGYLAPEVSFTGRATPESDVYSFGMVVLELVCGRRSKGFIEEDSLVDAVWGLYEKGAVLDCVDKKLEGNFNEEQGKRTLIVGLACLHPDYTFRPRMRKVVQVFLNPDEPLIKLPESRPSAISLSFHSSSASTTTTDFASSSAPLTRGSIESLPDAILE